MTTEVTIVFWSVVAARFALPLFIPRFPLPAIIACLILDGVDQTIFQSFGFDPPGYQNYDKAMDLFYLAIAYLTTMQNWTRTSAASIAKFLFFYRLVGVLLFELTGARLLLLVFANTFEYFFIAYELVRTRWDPRRYGLRWWLLMAAGIWIGHERHGFNYSDSAQLDRQRDAVRAAVTKHRDHPALLLWGLGNEMEGPESDGRDPRIWKDLDVLADIVKQADPHHPVMTVIAGAGESKIKGILEHYPSLDILGINAYAGAGGAVAAARRVGWKKPIVLAEFGPHGHWEVAKTTWGAPIEPSGREKAASYSATMAQLGKHRDVCLGSYVFLWGQKQEVTATWYGMFLSTGEKLPVVDATSRGWTGKWPANRAPVIVSIDTALRETRVAAGKSISAKAVAEDADADPLTWQWAVVRESTDRKAGGDAESAPPAVAGAVTPADGPAAVIVTPREAGAYRLFVTVRDGRGGACTDNIPFFVEP